MRSARYRIERAFAQWKETAASDRKRRKFETWLAELRSHPPDVLVGSNFAEYGGVRAHIHAIQKYSTLRVQLAPSDELLLSLGPHDLTTTFKEAFLNFEPAGIRTIHSHVFPWFIEWCRRHQGAGSLWVHTYHLPYFPEHSRGALLPWQEEINDVLVNKARHADVRISVARWEQAWLRDNHGIDTIYLPNGVDVALCERADPQRSVERVGKSDFILYVGRNDPVKNPAEFVRLAHRMPRQQFVMIGQDLSAHTLLAEWQVTVPDNVLVYGGASHSEVQDALAACGALVVTSKREGLPTIVLEAMAHSKPVVVPNEAGCVEAIGGGECGLVYLPGDVDDLAAKTIAALGDTGMGARGRKRALAEYDWRVVAPKLDALYGMSPETRALTTAETRANTSRC